MSASEKHSLGEMIKLLRQKAGVLQEDLAPILDIPQGILAKIESNVTRPTVATLLKLSQYFEIPMEEFLSEGPMETKLQVTRAEEYESTERPRASGETASSYEFKSLAPNLKDKHMQPFLIELDPKVPENLPPLSHNGEEFLYVIDGNVEFHADKEAIALNPGDSIYFHSEIPHAVFAKGPGKARAVVVVYSDRLKKK